MGDLTPSATFVFAQWWLHFVSLNSCLGLFWLQHPLVEWFCVRLFRRITFWWQHTQFECLEQDGALEVAWALWATSHTSWFVHRTVWEALTHHGGYGLIVIDWEFGISLQLAAISHTRLTAFIAWLDFIKTICQSRSMVNTATPKLSHTFEYQKRKQVELPSLGPCVTLCFFS